MNYPFNFSFPFSSTHIPNFLFPQLLFICVYVDVSYQLGYKPTTNCMKQAFYSHRFNAVKPNTCLCVSVKLACLHCQSHWPLKETPLLFCCVSAVPPSRLISHSPTFSVSLSHCGSSFCRSCFLSACVCVCVGRNGVRSRFMLCYQWVRILHSTFVIETGLQFEAYLTKTRGRHHIED